LKIALLLLTSLVLAHAARAEPVRVLVSIGSDNGDPEDAQLHFAREDALRVRSLFVDIGGVSPERAYTVLGRPAQAVRETLSEVAGRVAELSSAGKEVLLIVYVSAHARSGELHLAGSHLALSELRDYMQKSPASLRLLIVDACESGAIARFKGGVPGPEYQVALQALPLSGQVMISSSGPAEVSQELDALGGSLFTHHLLTGLRGDADADGNGLVTLNEAYAYAYSRTVAQSEGSVQHPVVDLDVHGAGELVLTQPQSARSALIFPASLHGDYLVVSQPRTDIVAEVHKTAGKPVQLAVQPGRYLVRKRDGRRIGFMNVDLTYGGKQTIDERELSWRDYLEVSFKGADLDPHPSAIYLLGGFGSAPQPGTAARWHGGVAYRRTLGDVWVLGSLSVGSANYRAVSLQTYELEGSLGVAGGYRWLSLPFIPFAGLALDLNGYRQSYVRDGEASIQRVFGQGPLPGNSAFGLDAGPLGGVEIPLPKEASLLLTVKLPVRYLPAAASPSLSIGVEAFAAIGVRL
jgi:hypothetical protein